MRRDSVGTVGAAGTPGAVQEPTTERWAIGEVARLSGVSSRTLRHYHAIGLLEPVGVAAGGRRVYGRAELLRLQQILLLRELGVDLATIREVLADEGPDLLVRLREHRDRLVERRDRLDRLVATVTSTIESLERGHVMAAKDLYQGFDHSRYEAEARERWGDAAVDRSNEAWATLGPEGQAEFRREQQEIGTGLAGLLAEDVPVEDERVQALVARHYAQILHFWTPSAEAYRNLGQMYVDDPHFTATYDAVAPGLARYLRDAMSVYARDHLD